MHDGVMADADGHTCMMGMHDGVLKYSSIPINNKCGPRYRDPAYFKISIYYSCIIVW